MWINFSYERWEPAADNARLASAADLIMDERGVTNWGQTGRQWPAPADWLAILRSTRALEAAGRCYLMNGQEPERGRNIPRSARLWNIANYLLLKERCTFMHISGVQEYGKLLVYPEYEIPIGHPVGPPSEQEGVWRRAYSNGLVLVNPEDTPATVVLDGSYTDDRGKAVASPVELGPHSAAILLPVPLARSPR